MTDRVTDQQLDDAPVVTGPRLKPADKYLRRSQWVGEPVPSEYVGPWGLGQTCWYFIGEHDGLRLVFAAETTVRARQALDEWIALGCPARYESNGQRVYASTAAPLGGLGKEAAELSLVDGEVQQ